MRPVCGSWREAAAHLVASAALLEYKRRDDLERREAADGLSGLSQELGPHRDGLRRGHDADVLYPGALRDPLIRIARLPHLVQAKWTEDILDEMARALRKNLPEITDEKTSRLRHLMNTAVRDCLVTGYEPLIPVVELPGPGDRRVLAAGIRANAQIMAARNPKHFPADLLAPWDIGANPRTASSAARPAPDRQAVWACLQQIADSRTRNPVTIDDVLDELQRSGLAGSATVPRVS